MRRIPEVGFKWNILLKGGYELGFEGYKGCEYVVVYGINLVLFRIFKKSKGRKRKNTRRDIYGILSTLMQIF